MYKGPLHRQPVPYTSILLPVLCHSPLHNTYPAFLRSDVSLPYCSCQKAVQYSSVPKTVPQNKSLPVIQRQPRSPSKNLFSANVIASLFYLLLSLCHVFGKYPLRKYKTLWTNDAYTFSTTGIFCFGYTCKCLRMEVTLPTTPSKMPKINAAGRTNENTSPTTRKRTKFSTNGIWL